MTSLHRARAGASLLSLIPTVRKDIEHTPPSAPPPFTPTDLASVLADLRHAAAYQRIDYEAADSSSESWFVEEVMRDANDLAAAASGCINDPDLDRNAIRAERGRLIAERYRREQRLETLDSALGDLVADLAHAALAAGLDPEDIIEMGLWHHREEVESGGAE